MEEKINFLKNLHLKTTEAVPCSMTPNMSGRTLSGSFLHFKNYIISEKDFENIFRIILEELLLIIPKESLMGFIEGYCIYSLDGKLIFAFSEKNIPGNSSLKELFLFCQTEQNKTILAELQKEGMFSSFYIDKRFEDYNY